MKNKKILKPLTVAIIFLSFNIAAAQEITSESNFIRVVGGLKFPEGPAWDGNSLFVSNCYGNWITKINSQSVDSFVVAPTYPVSFQKTNGLAVYKDGSLFACDYGIGAILKFSKEGRCVTISSGYNGVKFNRPNDLAFDDSGNLYFTDPKSYDINIADGRIFRIVKQTNQVQLLTSGLAFPNGIAFSPNLKYLYICESVKHRILKYSINADGTLGEFEVFAELKGGDPDGIAFDVKGNLYVAHFGGGSVIVLNKKGEMIERIIAPGKNPSNLEFAGKDLKELYLTEDETNAVYKLHRDVAGLKLFSSPN